MSPTCHSAYIAGYYVHSVLCPSIEIRLLKQVPHDNIAYEVVSGESVKVINGKLNNKDYELGSGSIAKATRLR